jgi:hypothetical protein
MVATCRLVFSSRADGSSEELFRNKAHSPNVSWPKRKCGDLLRAEALTKQNVEVVAADVNLD